MDDHETVETMKHVWKIREQYKHEKNEIISLLYSCAFGGRDPTINILTLKLPIGVKNDSMFLLSWKVLCIVLHVFALFRATIVGSTSLE